MVSLIQRNCYLSLLIASQALRVIPTDWDLNEDQYKNENELIKDEVNNTMNETQQVIRESHIINICIIGDDRVGKTCLARRYVNNSFTPTYLTLAHEGIDSNSKTIINGNAKIELILKTQKTIDRTRNMSPFYRRANIVLVVYDVTNQVSFNHVRQWLQEADLYAGEAIRIIVGNKCDLNETKVVDYNAAKEFADSWGIKFFETSASSNKNVEAVFQEVVDQYLKQRISLGKSRHTLMPGQGEDEPLLRIRRNDTSMEADSGNCSSCCRIS